MGATSETWTAQELGEIWMQKTQSWMQSFHLSRQWEKSDFLLPEGNPSDEKLKEHALRFGNLAKEAEKLLYLLVNLVLPEEKDPALAKRLDEQFVPLRDALAMVQAARDRWGEIQPLSSLKKVFPAAPQPPTQFPPGRG